MSWIDTWVMKDGMHWYNGDALWMYAGMLINPDIQPTIPDWLDRVYDIARNGDAVARNRAITILASDDAENPEFKRMLQIWAFANEPQDVASVSDYLLETHSHFMFVKRSANSIWWRLNGHTTERGLGTYVQNIMDKPKKKAKAKPKKKNKDSKKVSLNSNEELRSLFKLLPNSASPNKFKPRINLPNSNETTVDRTANKSYPQLPPTPKQSEKK